MQEKFCTGRVSEKLWALKVNEMLFIWMGHIISQNNPFLLFGGAHMGLFLSYDFLFKVKLFSPTLFTL